MARVQYEHLEMAGEAPGTFSLLFFFAAGTQSLDMRYHGVRQKKTTVEILSIHCSGGKLKESCRQSQTEHVKASTRMFLSFFNHSQMLFSILDRMCFSMDKLGYM